MATSTSSPPKLGPLTATAVVLGNIVGVMIFLTQSDVAKHLPWNSWFLAAWAIGGVLALFGALSYGELGAMMPKAGGDYVYIREALGPRTAFLSGWTSVVITFPGSIAAMAVGLCFYQGPVVFGGWVQKPLWSFAWGSWTYKVTGAQLLAIGVILLLTVINHIGLKVAGWLQATVTILPILLMLAAGVAVFFVSPTSPLPAAVATQDLSPWAGLWPAIALIFFAFAGWNATTYIGSEIDQPGRNIPLSLTLGTLLAVAVYLLISWVFLQGVPAASMPNARPTVYIFAIQRLFGSSAGHLLTLVIALAVLGSLNATVMVGARISEAMSQNGVALPSLQHRHPRFQTPTAALWLQGGLACILVLSGRFDQLVKYTAGVMMAFSSLTVLALFVLRVRQPDTPRPYKTWGYPWVPGIFVAFNTAVLVGLCIQSTYEVLWGVAITLLGVPVYAWYQRSTAS
ncbi:MAG: amino acid permease [Deltaproteobacteria bacterium]|nr:MAG: amino acid permease [Deltaproteobacteria bacterium]